MQYTEKFSVRSVAQVAETQAQLEADRGIPVKKWKELKDDETGRTIGWEYTDTKKGTALLITVMG